MENFYRTNHIYQTYDFVISQSSFFILIIFLQKNIINKILFLTAGEENERRISEIGQGGHEHMGML